jgi:hypothetical protein
MRYINWFWVAAGLFVAGWIMARISMIVATAAVWPCWVASLLLIITGWITFGIACIKR